MQTPSNRRQWISAFGGAAAWPFLANLVDGAEQTSKPKIKVAQIGVGHAHASKLSVYRNSNDYEVVGIVEADPKQLPKLEKVKAFQGLPRLAQEQVLNRDDIDVILVETEVRDSLDVAEQAIQAGKHVHLDKPAGESLKQYQRILQMAEKQQLLVQMGYMYRYNPAVVLMRQFLEKGWLGEPFEVHTVMSKVVPPAFRKSLAEYSGGMMFELGCHITDLAIGVLGKPREVVAFPQHVGSFQDDLLDNMLAVLSYPQATATVRSSALEVEGFARRHFVVCGTEGSFHIQPLDNPTATVALSKTRGEYKRGVSEVRFPRYSRYVGDAADMAMIIRGEKSSDFSYAHDLAVQETVLKACQKSK